MCFRRWLMTLALCWPLTLPPAATAIVLEDPVGFQVKLFFLAAVAIAGIYGAATVNRRILFVQTVPAVIALVAVLIAA